MPKGFSALQILFLNILVIGVWHVSVFIACIKLPPSYFDCNKSRFRPREWERGGRWYRDKLKINVWKDKVPQHVGKDGFSKSHITDVSIEYLDQFIMETCRGEWNHTTDTFCIVFVLIMNPLAWGLFCSFLILLGNLPFAAIQRYNRFRLLTVRKKLLRDLSRAEAQKRASHTVTT